MFYSFLILSFIPLISCSDLWYRDCSASDSWMKMESISIKPYPIKYPGSLGTSVTYTVINDIPSEDTKLTISLDKLTPKRMHVPCLNGFGSCTLDYCSDIEKNSLLSQFGYGKCPLSKGKHSVVNPPSLFPQLGPIFNKIMEGDFEANITLHSGKTNQVYNCFQFRMTVELTN